MGESMQISSGRSKILKSEMLLSEHQGSSFVPSAEEGTEMLEI